MKYLLISFLLIAGLNSFAQKQNAYYIKNNGQPTRSLDSADFIRIVREPDSGSVLYNVLEYYKNKRPKFVGKSSKIDPLLLEGGAITFYPNGKRKSIGHYNKGLKIGAFFEYYPNGQFYIQKQYPDNINYKTGNAEFDIKTAGDSTGNITVTDGEGYVKLYNDDFKKLLDEGPVKNGKRNGEWKGIDTTYKATFAEVYENGLLKSGTAADSAGQTFSYHERTEPPQYKGGIEKFYEYLGNTIRYPVQARNKNIQGKVFVVIWIERDGSITNLKTIRAPSADLAAEAIRVMENCPAWIPGKQYGKIERLQFTVPITFALQWQ